MPQFCRGQCWIISICRRAAASSHEEPELLQTSSNVGPSDVVCSPHQSPNLRGRWTHCKACCFIGRVRSPFSSDLPLSGFRPEKGKAISIPRRRWNFPFLVAWLFLCLAVQFASQFRSARVQLLFSVCRDRYRFAPCNSGAETAQGFRFYIFPRREKSRPPAGRQCVRTDGQRPVGRSDGQQPAVYV